MHYRSESGPYKYKPEDLVCHDRSKSFKTAVIVFVAMSLLSWAANAETVFLAEVPSSKVSDREALKVIASGKTAWKCEHVKSGPNLNPVKVPKTDATWHTADTLQGLENPFERLANGEPTVRCAQMEANTSNGRVRKAD